MRQYTAAPARSNTVRRALDGCARVLLLGVALTSPDVIAQTGIPAQLEPHPLVIIDTDIGDDYDDALAVALALASPEIKILGIASASGDTELRARLLDRLLCETGRTDIPVTVGIATHGAGQAEFTQARWAARQPERPHPPAVDFLLDQVRRHPKEITLIGIGPLTNLGAALERDPATFKLLRRIVIMGGSIQRGYGDVGYTPNHGPDAEYNIRMDVAAAQAVFGSGVPLYVMPLDSTQIRLDEVKRQQLFAQSTNLTDALSLLYQQWSHGSNQQTPTLYDDMAVAYAIDPTQCPVVPMRIEVDAKGYTRVVPGPPNSEVCLRSDSDRFFQFYIPRLLQQSLAGACARLP